MANSISHVSKPHPDFPLFPHASGRWCKKIRGRFLYFGKLAEDPTGQAALARWEAMLTGRRTPDIGLTVGDLLDRFLSTKDAQLSAGEIGSLTLKDYKTTANRLLTELGRHRLVSELTPFDFEHLRIGISKTRGPVALSTEIQRVRSIFKYAFEADLIEHPMRFGPMFQKPSQKVLRLARAARGPRLLSAQEIHTLLHGADRGLKAMILLGINCGFGNTDCATMPPPRGPWLDFPRPKTGVPRRCPLWSETLDALPSRFTRPFAGYTSDSISKAFRERLDATNLHRPGLGFYTLRHVFRTIADETKDQPAINLIMGHADHSIAASYRENISDDRLIAVTDHVRKWMAA